MTAAAVTVHLQAADLEHDLRCEAAWGLQNRPKQLSPKWFYDERGSALFEQITRLKEYYPTRAERAVLAARAEEIVAASSPETFIELGSGASEKTTLLLDAAVSAGTLRRFVPFDVCEPFLRAAASRLASRYSTLEVLGVVGDFERQLSRLPTSGRTLVALLGGTIGNLLPEQRARFLGTLAQHFAPGDCLLLGTDLVKDTARLIAAYDDAAGVTAAFNRNVLLVLNDRLGATFEPVDFDHVARWDPEHEWIEMHLRARRGHDVRVAALETAISFEAGELLRTEISAKFRRDGVADELAAAGFAMTNWWTDDEGSFAVSLSVRRPDLVGKAVVEKAGAC
ncbi:MAG: L-histidine N(alpha)-methyltransferase [Actinomycetota bacterium]|nr:L-histidine N(alpha)-methyltransferase [Actinomycetota bacterium]